jgi:hypothetical protein
LKAAEAKYRARERERDGEVEIFYLVRRSALFSPM